MCVQITRVSACWQCSVALEAFGKIRHCGNIVDKGEYCELKHAEVFGPPDLLCRSCLKKHEGMNKRNQNQKTLGK
jgi:hypothetical protein